MQTLRGIQGTKDTGYEWYQLLSKIFTKIIGMVVSVTNSRIFYWVYEGHYAYVSLATDDIIIAASDISLLKKMANAFN